MAAECSDGGALAQSVVFLRYFSDLPDPRQRGKVMDPLDEILLLCLLAVLAGAQTLVEIARFGQRKRELLRRFRPFRDGTPSHDHLGDILASLDAEAFRRCFVGWVASLTGIASDVIASDGKTLRRSYQKIRWHGCHPHGFSLRGTPTPGARASQGGGQVQRDHHIPKLREMMAIEGAIVTINASGCQREIARKMIDQNADYVPALKGNQGTLRDDVDLFLAEQRVLAEQRANGFKDARVSRDKTVDGDHGRIETTAVIHDVGWLDHHTWPGLKRIVVVDSDREINGRIETEIRLYITSLVLLAMPSDRSSARTGRSRTVCTG